MIILFDYVRTYWRTLTVAALIACVAFFLFFFRLHSLAPGYSDIEVFTNQTTQSIHLIWNNPENAPYKLVLWFAHKLDHHAILNARILSGLMAAMMTGLFFYVARSWLSTRVSLLATAIFATSSGLLHPGRYGAPYILQMGVLLILAAVLFYQTHRQDIQGWQKVLTRYLLAFLVILLIYVPGMIWFVLLGLGFMFKPVVRIIRGLSVVDATILSLLSIILLLPLAVISVQNVDFLRMLLGFPGQAPTLQSIGDNFQSLIRQLAFKSDAAPDLTLIGSSLLNSIELALVFLGLATQLRRPRSRTNYFILSALGLGLLLASLGGPVTYVAVIPLLYLLVAGGIYYLLRQWLEIFPTNPVAHIVGVVSIAILVGFSLFYHIRAYYAAWPHAPETKQAYQLAHPPKMYQ